MTSPKLALLALLVLTAVVDVQSVSSRHRKNVEDKGKAEENEKRNLFQDDEKFWARLLQGESSIITPLPPEECIVTVNITCMSADGTECQDLKSPPGRCNLNGGDPMTSVIFKYLYCTCDKSSNSQPDSTCTDFGSPVPSEAVDVTCSSGSDTTELTLEPDSQGNTVTIKTADGSILPSDIKCVVSAGDTVYQEFTVSMEEELNLKDKFGSFELVACNEQDCLVAVCYEYDLKNVGTSDMNITVLNRTGDDGDTVSLMHLLEVTSLSPNQNTSVTEKETVDLCVADKICIKVDVEADPPSGIPCFDNASYCFEIVPPSPGPTPPPSPAPTPEPTPPPSPAPTEPPVPGPTPPPSPAPTPEPTPPPSPAPTEPPVPGPTPPPSPAPTPEPTPPPSPAPTEPPVPGPTPPPSPAPTPEPTPPPSPAPTEPPVPGPTPPPSPAPTPEPTPPPSPAPTPEPTPPPSPAPTDAPTRLPTSEPPSAAPTEQCEFELDLFCPSCNATPPPVEQCTGRPYEMGMLFNGGDCDQSFNIQEAQGLFFCEDFQGGPPGERNATAFIVVTDVDGETIYFSDFAQVGSVYTLFDGGNNFEANQIITIYKDENIDPANILQRVQYHSSCSSNLFLKDRFGASQLVIWVNEPQGTVSCFANQTFSIDINIPLSISGGPAILQTLAVAINQAPFFYNLTDEVYGTVAVAGETVPVELAITIDLTSQKTYNLLVTLTALTTSGVRCVGSGVSSFTAGYPLPPQFPTVSPTQAPTRSALPPSVLASTACKLKADINCVSSRGTSCRSVSGPTAAVCNTEEGQVTGVDFTYTGNSCGESNNCDETSATDIADPRVYIVIEGDTIVFEGIVAKGETIILSGLEDDKLDVVISTVVGGPGGPGAGGPGAGEPGAGEPGAGEPGAGGPGAGGPGAGGPGVELQTLKIDLGCDGDVDKDLTLLQHFGALQVIGFTNPDQGTQSMIATFFLSYDVINVGRATALVETLVSESPFEGTTELIKSPPGLVLSTGGVQSYGEEVVINLHEKSGSQYTFGLLTTGEGVASGLACSSSATFTILIS